MVKKLLSVLVFSLFLFSCTSCVSFLWQSSEHAYPTESFVKMQTLLDDEVVASGSGSVVEQTENGTIVLTAAHICVNPQIEIVAKMEGMEKSLQAHGQDTEVISADMDVDVCLLKVEQGLRSFPTLSFSDEPPELQEPHFTISSPAGLADKDTNLVGMFEGLYVGDSEVLGSTRSFFSIPSTGGSSGAAIVNSDNEIVTITTHANRRFENMTIGPRHDKFYAFVAEALIPYSEEFTEEEHAQ